ncbi:MAG TPA: diguanylate cyclase, partial [bacterium]|nr:diguanylate cyclase [bacterium]
AAAKAAFRPSVANASGAVEARGGTVLVVDDVEDVRELVKIHLEAKGYSAVTAESGDEGIALARKHQPSCIVLDIEMPGRDGLETCRLLKADAMTRHIPVLFLTGHADDEKLAVLALAAGGNDFVQKPYAPSILLARVNSQVAIHEAQTRLMKAVMTDELTGVFSRRFLYESMRQQLKALHRAGPPSVAVLLVDVDHFKNVNDTLGHLEGDIALRNVAATLRRHVRGSDVVARFGGEEFVVVLPATRIQGAEHVAEKLRGAVETETRSARAPLTISIGVAAREIETSTDPESDAREQEVMDSLIREADEALYKAKAAGRNRVARYA